MCWRDWKWAWSQLLPQILEPKTASSKQKWRQIQPLWPLIRFAFVKELFTKTTEFKTPISGSEPGWPPGEHLCCGGPCWVVGWIAGDFQFTLKTNYSGGKTFYQGNLGMYHFITISLFQAAYDTSKGKLVKNNFSLGFATPDFVLHSNVNDGSIFGASLYQKVQYVILMDVL